VQHRSIPGNKELLVACFNIVPKGIVALVCVCRKVIGLERAQQENLGRFVQFGVIFDFNLK
jgi:hypothetical protein